MNPQPAFYCQRPDVDGRAFGPHRQTGRTATGIHPGTRDQPDRGCSRHQQRTARIHRIPELLSLFPFSEATTSYRKLRRLGAWSAFRHEDKRNMFHMTSCRAVQRGSGTDGARSDPGDQRRVEAGRQGPAAYMVALNAVGGRFVSACGTRLFFPTVYAD